MPKRLVIFVEGKGDVKAVPTLAQRVLQQLEAYDALFVDHEPFRVTGLGTLVKDNCSPWHRWLNAAGKTRPNLGAVLLVLDGDLDRVPGTWTAYSDHYRSSDFCAPRAAATLGHEARSSRAGDAFSLATVFVLKEFEAWLVAGVEGLRGLSLAEERGTIPDTATFPDIDIEGKRDAKGELRKIIPAYSETLDQAGLAAKIDLDRVRERCRAFRRFVHAIEQLAAAVRSGQPIVTPPL